MKGADRAPITLPYSSFSITITATREGAGRPTGAVAPTDAVALAGSEDPPRAAPQPSGTPSAATATTVGNVAHALV